MKTAAMGLPWTCSGRKGPGGASRSAGMVANSREVDDEDAVAKGTACNVGPPPLGI